MQRIKCFIYWFFYPVTRILIHYGIDVYDPHDYKHLTKDILKCQCCGWYSWGGGEGYNKNI